jgi:ABC-type uncharacterized transport system permease subunit
MVHFYEMAVGGMLSSLEGILCVCMDAILLFGSLMQLNARAYLHCAPAVRLVVALLSVIIVALLLKRLKRAPKGRAHMQGLPLQPSAHPGEIPHVHAW